MTALLKLFSLLHEEIWCQYNSITNDVYLATLEYA